MKKIFIILVALSFTLPLFSQDNRMGEHRDKIKALKVADITDKLNLSASEAEKFWPIYNAFENDQERLRSDTFKKRNEIDFETLTESEAQNLLDEMVGLGKQRYDLYNKFILDLKQVLPAKKIILLKKVEEEFKRKMIKEFRKRGSSKSRERP
jgi:hypothetical protein